MTSNPPETWKRGLTKDQLIEQNGDGAGVVAQFYKDIDRANAARSGLNVIDIGDVIEAALSGRPALIFAQRVIMVFVLSFKAFRSVKLRTAGLPMAKAVLPGSVERLRTVMRLQGMLGLVPMALSKGIGSEAQRPLAVVIIGGLVSATIQTLIVLPAL